MSDKKKPPPSVGIEIDGGSGLHVEGNRVEGHDVGIRVSGKGHTLRGNVAIKPPTPAPPPRKWFDTGIGRFAIAVAAGITLLIIANAVGR